MEAESRRRRENKILRYYPDTGPLRRALYPKHNAFFDAGATHPERMVIAANRIGKTEGITTRFERRYMGTAIAAVPIGAAYTPAFEEVRSCETTLPDSQAGSFRAARPMFAAAE